MAARAGVWIDYKQAIVVLLTDAGQETRKIAFDIGQPIQSASGGGKSRSRGFVAENTRERKVHSDRKDYYDDIIAAIRGTESVLILGPGEAKGEFNKHITSKKIRGLTVALETADKLTDRQLAARVSAYFSAPPTGKTGTSTTPAKKKPATASSGKRAKKTGK